MPDTPDNPQQDPAEGSREVIDRELARKAGKGQEQTGKGEGGKGTDRGDAQPQRQPASNQNHKP